MSTPFSWKFKIFNYASLMAQQIRNLPAKQEAQEMWVQSLSGEDPLEEEMATYSSIRACRIQWIQESGGLQFIELQRVRYD